MPHSIFGFLPVLAPHPNAAPLPTLLLQALMRFMFLGNLIGFPAIVAPTHLGANNLPIAVQVPAFALLFHEASTIHTLFPLPVQFMAAPWQEALLLRIAAVLEAELPTLPKPSAYFDIF